MFVGFRFEIGLDLNIAGAFPPCQGDNPKAYRIIGITINTSTGSSFAFNTKW